jgi:hypothetical protein
MKIGYHTFPSGKQYVFLEEGGERTFLRNLLILKNSRDPSQIAIVHEWGAGPTKSWEPPKGQMEWKEFHESGVRAGAIISESALSTHQRRGVLREMVEEAKFLPSEISDLTKLPLVYKQAWPESGLKNAFFMYQYWSATATPEAMLEAQRRMAELVADPDWKEMLPADATEKDAVAWWNPDRHGWDKIRGAFSKKMTRLYFNSL